jgi:phosphoadenosine phosphosulfate reductase
MVVLHMLRAQRPDIPVLFLDTVHHFEQTHVYREEMTRAWRLNVVTLRAEDPSPGLWRTSTDACCARHKVGPLFSALEQYDTWFTGLRRAQSPSRANLQELESTALPSGTVLKKVNPLAGWSTKDVWEYAEAHAIPLLPLYDLATWHHR